MTTAELVKQTLRGMQSLYQPIPSQLQSLYDFYWEHGGRQEQVASETAAEATTQSYPAPTFRVGDLVCLPSGGPVMTVCGVTPDESGATVVKARWFGVQGQLGQSNFSPATLELYTGDDEEDEDEDEEVY